MARWYASACSNIPYHPHCTHSHCHRLTRCPNSRENLWGGYDLCSESAKDSELHCRCRITEPPTQGYFAISLAQLHNLTRENQQPHNAKNDCFVGISRNICAAAQCQKRLLDRNFPKACNRAISQMAAPPFKSLHSYRALGVPSS